MMNNYAFNFVSNFIKNNRKRYENAEQLRIDCSNVVLFSNWVSLFNVFNEYLDYHENLLSLGFENTIGTTEYFYSRDKECKVNILIEEDWEYKFYGSKGNSERVVFFTLQSTICYVASKTKKKSYGDYEIVVKREYNHEKNEIDFQIDKVFTKSIPLIEELTELCHECMINKDIMGLINDKVIDLE